LNPGPKIRARQWSRTAFALALLFASLPLASRLFLGSWGFDGAGELAGLCLVLGAYFHIVSRRRNKLPDDAAMLYRSIELASARGPREAIELLNRVIDRSPRFWQAYQCRAELHLAQQAPELALADLSTAIQLAPNEPHLYRLRAHVYELLQDSASAAADLERASRPQ